MASDRRFITIAVLLMFHGAAAAQVFDPVAFEGDWRGRWHNLTFGSQDSAYLGVTIDTVQKTLRTVLDLDGNVFGGSDPDSVVMNGSYTSNGFTASGSGDPYGPISISGTGSGSITGVCPNVPNAGIDSVRFSGTYDEMSIDMTYIVYFAFGGGTANGTLTMEMQTAVSVGEEHVFVPDRFLLRQNYPNPFNPSTSIEYSVPSPGNVSVRVFDMLGKEIMTLVDGRHPAGTYTVVLNAENLAGGIYFYRLQSSGFSQVKRMILLK